MLVHMFCVIEINIWATKINWISRPANQSSISIISNSLYLLNIYYFGNLRWLKIYNEDFNIQIHYLIANPPHVRTENVSPIFIVGCK